MLDDILEVLASEARSLANAFEAVVEVTDGDGVLRRASAGTVPPPDALRVRVPVAHAGRDLGVLEVRVTAPVDEHGLHALARVAGAVVAHAVAPDERSEKALTDPLTGLANRRSWHEQLARALAHAERTNETVSVAVCAVGAGEARLAAVADLWRGHARAADLLARTGPDELAVLLPGADEVAAADVVRRLVDAAPPDSAISFGVAEWDLREDAADLTARGELRLRAASVASA